MPDTLQGNPHDASATESSQPGREPISQTEPQQSGPSAGTPPAGQAALTPAVQTPAAREAEMFDDDAEALNAYRTLEARRKRRRRNHIIVGCIVGALALAGIGWWASNNLLVDPAEQSKEPSFDLGYAVVGTYESSVTASGAIKPASQVVVTPEVDGIIENVRVAEGDSVQKDDVLFTLRNAALDKAVQDAEQGLKTANNNVASAQSALDSANNAYARALDSYNTVFATGYETQEEADAAGAQAIDALNSAESAAREAEITLENAQLAVTTAQEALDQANANAEKRTVTAPQSGAVVAMGAVEGASVGSVGSSGATQGTGSLVTIADLTSLRVSVKVNEIDINNLSEGQEAEVTFTALPEVTLSAVVEHIAAISSNAEDAQAGSGGVVTYDVDLVIAEPDARVKPGMTARVKILTERIGDATTVPVSALTMTDESNATLQVVTGYEDDGTPVFEERTVRVVAQDSTTAAVEGSLADGDAVMIVSDTSEMVEDVPVS